MLWKKLKTQKGKEQPISTSNKNQNGSIKQYKKMDLHSQLQLTDEFLEVNKKEVQQKNQALTTKNLVSFQEVYFNDEKQGRTPSFSSNRLIIFGEVEKTKAFNKHDLDDPTQTNLQLYDNCLRPQSINQQLVENNQQNIKRHEGAQNKLSKVQKQKGAQSYFSAIPQGSKSELYKQFKSLSQGISENQRDNIKSGIKWSGQDPVIMYSEPSSEEDGNNSMRFGLNTANIGTTTPNQRDMEVDEFFKQIQQAGVDISYLQSNPHRSRKDSWRSPLEQAEELRMFIKSSASENGQVGQVNAKSQFASSQCQNQFDKAKSNQMQNNESNGNQQKEGSKNDNNTRLYQLSLSNKKQISFKQQKMFRIDSNRASKKQGLIKKLKGVVDEITMVKLQMQILKSNDACFNQIYQQVQECSLRCNAWFQKKENNKIQWSQGESKTIQELKYRILELEADIMQKQAKIKSLTLSLEQCNSKCQEIGENLFDANQKIAQSELIFASRLASLMEKYEEKETGKQTRSQQFPDVEIRRLSEEVEQLTKLYEQSQLQQKNALQSQKMLLSIEQEKLARRQVALHQKELRLNKIEEQLNERDILFNKQELQSIKKREEISNLQKVLMEKFQKMEQLEAELNEGFVYIEEVKKENYENMMALEEQKNQLQSKVGILERKAQTLQKQLKAKKQVDFSVFEMKSNSTRNAIAEQDKLNIPKFAENRNQKWIAENDDNYEDFYVDPNQQIYNLDGRLINQFNFVKPNLHTDRTKYQKNENARLIIANKEKSQRYLQHQRPCRTEFEYPMTDFTKSEYRSQTGSNQGYFDKGRMLMDGDYNARVLDSKLRKYKTDKRFMSQVLSAGKIEYNMSRVHELREPKLQIRSQKSDKNLRNLRSLGKKLPQNQKIGELDTKIENLRKQIKKQISVARQN